MYWTNKTVYNGSFELQVRILTSVCRNWFCILQNERGLETDSAFSKMNEG
jgi:hypothetical protein